MTTDGIGHKLRFYIGGAIMFRQKNENFFKHIDDRRVTVNDFCGRERWFSYTPKSYVIDPRMSNENLKQSIDQYLDTLLKGGAVDDGNADVLDDYILAIARTAISDMIKQRVSHRTIARQLCVVWQTDKEDFVALLKRKQAELQILEGDYHKTCQKLAAYASKGEKR